MTEKVEAEVSDNEPVSKRTRRAGIVTSVGDPNLKDRSKVAPLFLSKKEKLDKEYKKETEKLVQSTKTRMNDWKSVIGVEKDAAKVCPVFQRASLSSSQSQSVSGSASHPRSKPDKIIIKSGIPPLVDFSLTPDPYSSLFQPPSNIILHPRNATRISSDFSPGESFCHCLDLPPAAKSSSSPLVDLRTPCKPPSPSDSPLIDEFPDIDKNLKSACISALTAMSVDKHPDSSSCQLSEWSACNTRDWNAARLEPRKQHILAKWLAKWKDEDTAVRRNKVAPILLVTGPVGSGKTSLVYTAAAELNVQVLEVSPADFSWQGGKRQISEAIREALQSRQVRQDAMSQIVLIDDVDVLIKQDKSVLNSIASITDDSKRPLVLTCTNLNTVIGPDIVQVSEIFPIESPTRLSMSFMAHAYQRVLGNERSSRVRCESLANNCGTDLRKLAIGCQMMYLDSKTSPHPDTNPIPRSLFPVDFPQGILNSSKIVEFLRMVDGLPFNRSNLFSALMNEVKHAKSISDFTPLISSACISDLLGNDLLADYLILRTLGSTGEITCEDVLNSPSLYTVSDWLALDWRDTLVTRFVTRATVSSIGVDAFKIGETVSALSVMAQVSNSLEFNSRRLRCVLHQFGLDVPEIEQLKRIPRFN
jgi:hypothetical protein